ncbi:hypothetical protein IEU95_11740 [Hoyosella rhizosphaerae]|uniref:Uncharacterized protein n=1 Tax=Hoyosella rhizosphaerae TaxID=1755582 RepID=A0A916UAI2_9ACTN|nr:hypothetical protein [Hoyosella rhizosphaerae]MBN4927505.1 hypothetical protein [Hoyosella rhizosphaerae]GGC63960.1 hypothetical protein GCM10011410_15510 [Hoyosella rhizosphaerae]
MFDFLIHELENPVKKNVIRGAIASAAVAPLMLAGAGVAAAAPSGNAFVVPFVGITVVSVSGSDAQLCGAANDPLAIDLAAILAAGVTGLAGLLPGTPGTVEDGRTTIIIPTPATSEPFDIYVACIGISGILPVLELFTIDDVNPDPFAALSSELS